MTVVELFDIVRTGGVIGLMTVIIIGGFRKWYVWKWQYEAEVVEKIFWRDMALSGGRLAEKSTGILERVVKHGVS